MNKLTVLCALALAAYLYTSEDFRAQLDRVYQEIQYERVSIHNFMERW